MFWRVASGGVSSINTILERESFTLKDLLEEDDVVQASSYINSVLNMAGFALLPLRFAKVFKQCRLQVQAATSNYKPNFGCRKSRRPTRSCWTTCSRTAR